MNVRGIAGAQGRQSFSTGLEGIEADPVGERSASHEEPQPNGETTPPLRGDRAFWGIVAAQFLGAFNDNVFKQLVLLLALTATVGGSPQDLQGLGVVVFALPFLLFSGIAGYFSERYSKRQVIILSKAAEIVVMLCGVVAFASFSLTGFVGLFFTLFLMGAQSAFFSPGKYGILPELFRPHDLPQANGVILMTSFLAILFGIPLAGLLLDITPHLWIASVFCVLIAMAGTVSALMVRGTPAAKPNLRVTASAFIVPRDVILSMRADPLLPLAVLASGTFWLVGSLILPSVSALGKVQLGLSYLMTSVLTAAVGVGIALGSLLAGWLARGAVSFKMMRIGVWGCLGMLLLVAAINPPLQFLPTAWRSLADSQQAAGYRYAASLLVLAALGVFTGFFAVPLQVFLQSRAPKDQKGRVIAAVNLANWIAIVLGGLLYIAFSTLLNQLAWPPSALFVAISLLVLPVTILYRPKYLKQPV
jgi:acyl-[acyl-carrier-protein]-phospholipid O-acyltransferase/long-chain-fatty-acid--[acyl-carrier-protein] ligase